MSFLRRRDQGSTPKGFSVSCLVLRISSRIFSAVASGVETAVAAVSPAFGPEHAKPTGVADGRHQTSIG